MEKLRSWFKKSIKRHSDESEAVPSKRFKKDDSSLIKDDQVASNSSKKAEVFPIMENCGNVSLTYHGPANNISTHIVNNYNFTKEPTNVIKDESSIIIVQKTVRKEVFPNDKVIMKLIWKYLELDDKTDCTLVCNRLNDIISDMNCFRLVLQFDSRVQIIPTVSRHYKKLFIQGYHCKSLLPKMHKMLKDLSQSVTDLTLDCCEFDIIPLSQFLSEFTLLESLKLNIFITKDSICELSAKELPNLSQLKDFIINVNDNQLNEIMNITRSASNIQSLTLFDVIFDENAIAYLIKYKKLTSLILNKCIMEKPPLSVVNSLHFSSSVKQPLISKHSNKSVTDLTLDDCKFDFVALSKFIREFPLLESLKLNVFMAKDSICKLSEEELPNLSQLKDFNIKANDKLNEILYIAKSASNIQSLIVSDAILNEHHIVYLTKFENSLTSLSLTKCIMDTSFMSNLNSLHFGSSVKISSLNFKSFDCLNKLRKLELNNINNGVLGILKKKWAQQLEECTITFNYKQKNYVERYFTKGFLDHFSRQTYPDIVTRSDNGELYKKECFRTDEKMIEFFEPFFPFPSVDDINNNMCYFKVTPIKKTEDFLRNRRKNSIIPSSLLQDILIAEKIKKKPHTMGSGYSIIRWLYIYEWNKEYRKWCAEDDKWYREYYYLYKVDDKWWQVCDDWKKEYSDWCACNQEWYREYYKCYKRKYEWWEVCDDWKKEYDDWIDLNHELYIEYFNWYRDYHKYKIGCGEWNKKDLKWCRDFHSWYSDYENYKERYIEWIKEDHERRRELNFWYNIFDKESNEWCDGYDKFCDENGGWNEKYHEDPEEYDKEL